MRKKTTITKKSINVLKRRNKFRKKTMIKNVIRNLRLGLQQLQDTKGHHCHSYRFDLDYVANRKQIVFNEQ